MLKHIVMWNVRGDDAATRERHIALLKTAFESLRGRVPGLLHVEVGVDESRIDYACDVVLYTEFDSREALAAYAEHPEHLRVKRALGDLRIARHQVDYDAGGAACEPTPKEIAREGATTPSAGSCVADTDQQPGDTDHVQTLR
jgi:heme-degrading monooxygenase HmoA